MSDIKTFDRAFAWLFVSFPILITVLVAVSFALEWLLYGAIQIDSFWTVLRGFWIAYLLIGEVLCYLQLFWDFVKWVWSWFVPKKESDER
ncbi:hypothetical protein [Aliiroseovarius sp. F20344]|uniref:hypothetical protein n=1 Tax=Aliiroseovarius sp. F20344 TaxID=2926414 RepID=UPI001FF6E80B|nr:hypothetical protein [Aliiroseovarius sp. F20344]MCK0141817.1 hypothetical protein [Aliiroseovarius sp. F20344]